MDPSVAAALKALAISSGMKYQCTQCNRILNNGIDKCCNHYPEVVENKDEEFDICNWIDSNRKVQCGPKGVEMYMALLMYDLETGKSGYDSSPMPIIDITNDELVSKIEKHVIMRANENKKNKT